MNEKIRELRDKSLEKYVFTDIDGDNNHGIRLNEEKFAELIVRECYKIAMKEGNGFYCPSDILEHFGVE